VGSPVVVVYPANFAEPSIEPVVLLYGLAPGFLHIRLLPDVAYDTVQNAGPEAHRSANTASGRPVQLPMGAE
jgi:hypothetical protein